jgi:hypothetical protein
LILADQQSHDDLFTGRALTGESGQHMQAFLEAMGIRSKYLIIRVLPVDTLDDEATPFSDGRSLPDAEGVPGDPLQGQGMNRKCA